MSAEDHGTRSLPSELATLVAECALRPEEWLKNRLEAFHADVEKRYTEALAQVSKLQKENQELKDENSSLRSGSIDTILRSSPDMTPGVSLTLRQDLAQHRIDSIIAQNGGAQNSSPSAKSTSPPSYAAWSGSGTQSHGSSEPKPYYQPRNTVSLSPIHYFQPTSQQPMSSMNAFKSAPARVVYTTQQPLLRPTPKCKLCWTMGTLCDGLQRCQRCTQREASCTYEDCSHGDDCQDMACVRTHPTQKAFQNQPYRG